MMLIKLIMILSIISMFWWRKNIIMILLNIELMMISLFILITLFNFITSSISSLFILTFMVSGSSIGLSLMINLSRSQYSSNSSFLWMLLY